MDLASETIVLVLTCELEALEPFQDNLHSSGWHGKHRLDRYADTHAATLGQQLVLIANLNEDFADFSIVGKLTEGLLDCILHFFTH